MTMETAREGVRSWAELKIREREREREEGMGRKELSCQVSKRLIKVS